MQYINGWSVYPCEGGYKGAKDSGKDAFGTRKRKTFRGETEKEVKRKIDKYEYEMATGQYIEPNKDTLSGFLDTYYKLTKHTWEETTAELYKMYIDVHIKPHFKEMKLRDVKPITLDEFYNLKLTENRIYYSKADTEKKDKKYRKPLSINTVNKFNTFFKAAFNYAVANDYIKKNPVANVQLKRPVDFEPDVYNKDQFLKLLSFVIGKDEEVPIVLGAGCGLRRGEMCGLKWKNIDFDNNKISIEKTAVRFNKNIEKSPKNKSSKRVVVAPSYVMQTLDAYLKRIGGANDYDKVITKWKPQSLTGRFSDLIDKFELPHTRLHDLRHYNATIMMTLNIPDKQAAARLGHSNVQTLRKTYQHILKGMDEDVAEKINSTFTDTVSINAEDNRKNNLKAV